MKAIKSAYISETIVSLFAIQQGEVNTFSLQSFKIYTYKCVSAFMQSLKHC